MTSLTDLEVAAALYGERSGNVVVLPVDPPDFSLAFFDDLVGRGLVDAVADLEDAA